MTRKNYIFPKKRTLYYEFQDNTDGGLPVTHRTIEVPVGSTRCVATIIEGLTKILLEETKEFDWPTDK